MIKLIVTDMDGTFLNDNHEIHSEFWDIFEELKRRGIFFAVASGRQYYNLLKNFNRIKDDILFIAENGTYIVQKNEELFIDSMDKDSVADLVKIGREIKTSELVLCGKKSAYVESNKPEFIAEVEKYYERYEIVSDILEIEDDILKVTICDLTGSEENAYPKYIEYIDKFKVAISGKIWLDITNLDANKGVAVENVQKKLGITYDETMVFGDYLNDLDMMKSGKYSFAMENAHPELKKLSNFIARNNNEGGVIEAIKEYVLK